ncbi:MAG: BON domain-containing protein [Kiritimatiellia bacterium]
MKKPLRFLLLAAAATFAFSGCASLDGMGLGDDDTSDDGIASLAASRLNGDSMTASATLSVAVENGMATLYGTVPNEMTRQRALQILRDTPGIFDVLDRTRKF